MATYADENIMDEDVYFDRIRRIMAANSAGEDIVDMLGVPTDFSGDYFHRSTLEARLRCNESVFILGWRSPESGDAIAHNIRLARSFVRAQSMRVDQNLDMGVCLLFSSDTTWEDFSHDLYCISQRKTVTARHTSCNSITVAISYKHDARWNGGGTMENEVTRKEVFEKVRWFHNFTKRDIAVWIDQGLFVNGVPEGTWYEKGILPYAVFPILFCSEMKGDAISDVSPWLKIEAFMALRGNGLWCQNSMQNAWGTYFDSSVNAMRLLLQNVPAMKTYPATSPGQILLEALSRVLLDGSICPCDYGCRPEFQNFMHWAAQRLVLCKSMPILSTLDEEDASHVSRSIMLLAVKQALFNLVAFKLGRHVLLPWSVRTHQDIPRTTCELLDKTLDPTVKTVLGAGTIGASVPSHIEPFGEQGFQCFVAVKKNFCRPVHLQLSGRRADRVGPWGEIRGRKEKIPLAG